jgi:outer membrane protein assembly factor BamB
MLSSLASGDLDGDGVDEIVACGIRVLATQAVVIAYDASGRERWRHDIGRTSVEHMPSIAIGRFGPHGRQVAVGGADGTVTLLGARGSVVGSQALGVRIKGLSALPGSVGQPDRLVVATEDDCGCYAWKPAKP